MFLKKFFSCHFFLWLVLFSVPVFSTNTYQDSINSIDNSEIHLPTFEDNWKEKYKSNDFNYIESDKKNQHSLAKIIENWITRTFNFNSKQANQYVIYFYRGIFIILFLIVLYAVFKSFKKQNNLWENNDKRISNDNQEIIYQIKTINFEKEINAQISQKEYRAVIRLYYLWTLKRLEETKHINLHEEKTNSDYYYEIKKESLRKEFSYLSYLYEYIWYGNFAITEEQFQKAAQSFQSTIKSIY